MVRQKIAQAYAHAWTFAHMRMRIYVREHFHILIANLNFATKIPLKDSGTPELHRYVHMHIMHTFNGKK